MQLSFATLKVFFVVLKVKSRVVEEMEVKNMLIFPILINVKFLGFWVSFEWNLFSYFKNGIIINIYFSSPAHLILFRSLLVIGH